MTKPIGELNGYWAIGFKATLFIMPLIVSLQVWIVSNIFSFQAFMGRSDFVTARDLSALELKIERQMQEVRLTVSEMVIDQRKERQSQITDLDEKLSKKLDTLNSISLDLKLELVQHIAWERAGRIQNTATNRF